MRKFLCGSLLATGLILMPEASIAQDAAKAEPPAAQAGEAEAAPKEAPKQQPKKLVLKKTGQVVFKCGDQFTDQPVCPDKSKPKVISRSVEDEQRCDQFRRTNYIPWYCRK